VTSFLEPEFETANEREGFRGRRAKLGRQAGCEHLGMSLFELEPGSAQFPVHYHLGNEELLIVLTGEVALRTPDGESVYRQCSTGHHHHLVCRGCGLTVEIEGPAVETWANKTARAHGFAEIEHTLEIFGTCQSCAHPAG